MRVSLWRVLREWGRIGCTGFGGPPAHIRLLRQLCVERESWLDEREFEDAIAVCNLMPGPASTQLSILCAWRVRGRLGALAGGTAFIVPGLIVILALSVLFVEQSPPLWVLGAGAGAGAAVPAVAVQAAWSLMRPSWGRRRGTVRWAVYLAAGLAAAALAGPWLVLVLLGCGLAELLASGGVVRGGRGGPAPSPRKNRASRTDRGDSGTFRALAAAPAALAGAATVSGGILASVAWVALKVGGLSFGGGFVIIPLMQADAVSRYHWMSGAQFLNAVALGQVTPGPVVQTVAVVGYAAAGIGGGLLASAVAFTPSFALVLLGAPRFDVIRDDRRARAFLDGAGPAAIGAILGSAITLGLQLTRPWQAAVLACALALLLPLRRGVVLTLASAGAVGVIIALAAGTVSPLPSPRPAAVPDAPDPAHRSRGPNGTERLKRGSREDPFGIMGFYDDLGRVDGVRGGGRGAVVRGLPLQRPHHTVLHGVRRPGARGGGDRLRIKASRRKPGRPGGRVRARRRRDRRGPVPAAVARARPSRTGQGRMGRHLRARRPRLPGAGSVGAALAGARARHVETRRRAAEHLPRRGGGRRPARRANRRPAARAARRRGQLPARRCPGPVAVHPAGRQPDQPARRDRGVQRRRGRRARRGRHPVRGGRVAEAAAAPAPGMGRASRRNDGRESHGRADRRRQRHGRGDQDRGGGKPQRGGHDGRRLRRAARLRPRPGDTGLVLRRGRRPRPRRPPTRPARARRRREGRGRGSFPPGADRDPAAGDRRRAVRRAGQVRTRPAL